MGFKNQFHSYLQQPLATCQRTHIVPQRPEVALFSGWLVSGPVWMWPHMPHGFYLHWFLLSGLAFAICTKIKVQLMVYCSQLRTTYIMSFWPVSVLLKISVQLQLITLKEKSQLTEVCWFHPFRLSVCEKLLKESDNSNISARTEL